MYVYILMICIITALCFLECNVDIYIIVIHSYYCIRLERKDSSRLLCSFPKPDPGDKTVRDGFI